MGDFGRGMIVRKVLGKSFITLEALQTLVIE